jgi:hypothetical protein
LLTRGSAVSEAQRLAVEREAVRGEHEPVEDKHPDCGSDDHSYALRQRGRTGACRPITAV